MNGHTENKKNTYAHLDRLSTEALEELLCADIKSPDDDDDEVVLHILEVIEQREKAIPTGRLSDVDKALEEFQTYYNIPEMNGVTLYPEENRRERDRCRYYGRLYPEASLDKGVRHYRRHGDFYVCNADWRSGCGHRCIWCDWTVDG